MVDFRSNFEKSKKWLKSLTEITWIKLIISLGSGFFIVIRFVYPDIKIDVVTLGLLAVAVLPWFSALIESAKFPGGFEIKFWEMQQAASDVTDGKLISTTTTTTTTQPPQQAFLTIASTDANLALVGLRIEIEKRVRAIASKNGIQGYLSLRNTLDTIRDSNIIDARALSGLDQIIEAGNRAAHGANVEPSVAGWAISYGPAVLQVLDNHLKPGNASCS